MSPDNTLPIDQSVKIPAAVRRASELANQAHKAAYTTGEAPAAETPQSNSPSSTGTTTPPPVEPKAPATTPTQASDSSTQNINWEHRYISMKGRYDQAMSRINSLEAAQMAQPAPVAQPVAPVPPELRAENFVTRELREQYGEEFFDAVSRGAKDALKDELNAKEAEIQRLSNQLGSVAHVAQQDARSRLFEHLNSEIPNWEELNTDQNFLNWLRLPDPYSGDIRQNLLTRAFERLDAPRVLAFFKGFLHEEAAVAPTPSPTLPAEAAKPGLDQFAAPGRGKPTQPQNPAAQGNGKPIISRSDIATFYADVSRGAYRNNAAEKDRIEAMIWSAQQEGRIR